MPYASETSPADARFAGMGHTQRVATDVGQA